ncbi:uncharacterized protein LOC143491537 [Brachyhypopomus gauderio]|uniref:uncharacterized protein LOC143491537 n=1 Tax=Brachyhypopomus gauderio TaxID=698409 RepID=UPI00404350F6
MDTICTGDERNEGVEDDEDDINEDDGSEENERIEDEDDTSENYILEEEEEENVGVEDDDINEDYGSEENVSCPPMQGYRSCAKKYQQILKRPLFVEHSEPMDLDSLEGHVEEFMTDLKTLTHTFCTEEGDEKEDDGSENNSSEEYEKEEDEWR